MTTTTLTLVDPVGPVEIAERLGVTLNTVHSWRTRSRRLTRADPLPAEACARSGTPLWEWATIETWARQTGRLA